MPLENFVATPTVGFVSFKNIDFVTGTFSLNINFIAFCTLIF